MKKCRYMSKKFIVPIFSLLLFVSAFFYAPIDVLASENTISTPPVSHVGDQHGSAIINRIWEETIVTEIVLPSGLVDGEDYVFTVDCSFSSSVNVEISDFMNRYAYWCVADSSEHVISTIISGLGDVSSPNASFVINNYSSEEDYYIYFISYLRSPKTGSYYFRWTLDVDKFDITSYSVAPIEAGQSGDFTSGYNAGYSQGFIDGENSGYSDGYQAGVDSVDTDSIYNSGFQAGVDSVDPQSFYDAGYNAGYNIGLEESYDTGFEDGYADAMERIENWGADGSDYPILISESTNNIVTTFHVRSGTYINGFSPSMEYYRNILALDSIDPNHTYKITFSCDNNVITKSNSNLFYEGLSYWLVVGGYEFPIRSVLSSEAFCFVPGDVMSSDILFKILVDCPRFIESEQYKSADLSVDFWDCNFKVFDYGPSGNTQNHIANQTDELTNGFDDSAGQQTSSRFSEGIAEYDEVEGSLFTSAKTGLTDYQFFNLESVPAVVTGISFVTATMTGIFNSMGGASGAGIVLSVLFSVMLVSIVAGLYRYFVSSGKGGKHDRKGGKG